MPTLAPGCHFVPRWRMRMLPARTRSPPNFFTPRRFDSESRPLREEPPAFLCAMVLLLCVHEERLNSCYERSRAHLQTSALRLLLRQFLGLLAPIIDLVGAERHVRVDACNILVSEGRQLCKRRQALFVQLLGSNLANALDGGQVVAFAFRCREQRSGGFGLLVGLGWLRFGLLRGGLLGRLGAIEQNLGDANRGQQLAMSALAARILAATLLERNDLRSATLDRKSTRLN